jgi:hypothetical protein
MDARAVFQRLLWMNPSDNLGTRLLLPEVKGPEDPLTLKAAGRCCLFVPIRYMAPDFHPDKTA